MNIVNTIPAQPIHQPVDFGWYTASWEPTVYQSAIGEFTLPYGLTTLTKGFETPADGTTSFSISALATTFIGSTGSNLAGTSFFVEVGQNPVPIGYLYIYDSATNWALIGYSFGPDGQAPLDDENRSFSYCYVIDGYDGGFNLTFNENDQIYDPRWIAYTSTLSSLSTTSIIFDALDSAHYGLPNSENANIVSFHWDLGNGLTADGPQVETTYWYSGQLNIGNGLAAPTQVTVTLTAIDIEGNIYHISHPLIFSNLYDNIGAPFTPGAIIASTEVASASNGSTASDITTLNVTSTIGFPTPDNSDGPYSETPLSVGIRAAGTTTLSAAITSSTATTIDVTSATDMLDDGTTILTIGTETMIVTGISGTTLTVTRGVNSIADSASDGATVNYVTTAIINYTGITSTTFTGCTSTSALVLATNMPVIA